MRVSQLAARTGVAVLCLLPVAASFAPGCGRVGLEPTSGSPPPFNEEDIASAVSATNRTFAAGSLVIPMDTTFQDNGTLLAFGLVHKLLQNSVTVYWAIQPGKAQGGTDFTASGNDWRTNAAVTNNAYRGGPFVIDTSSRAVANPIVTAWLNSN